jgi:hypothetical protein
MKKIMKVSARIKKKINLLKHVRKYKKKIAPMPIKSLFHSFKSDLFESYKCRIIMEMTCSFLSSIQINSTLLPQYDK